ncbi:MAG: hypothetical protein PQJ59_12365 [Spirochaetales bacterium]|nr:hypothetical protein [Spirochaetales bacterium]
MGNYKNAKLCRLIRKGIPATDPEGFAEVVKNATFFCKKCGASSRDKKCLCKPHKI